MFGRNGIFFVTLWGNLCCMKRFFLVLVGVVAAVGTWGQVSLDSCQQAARTHYPAVRKLALLEATRNIELADINKSWLPRVALVAQGTVQNAVPAFPEVLTGMLDQLGTPMDGLSKWQYRAGVEATQTLWDGGASRAQRTVRSAATELQKSSLEVELYALRERVDNLYFALLLLDEQTKQMEATKTLIVNKLEQVRTYVRNGIALPADADMIEAQVLSLEQQLAQARAARRGYVAMLQLLTGLDLENAQLLLPSATPQAAPQERPEFALFAARLNANEAARGLSMVALMPKFALFGQAFYGNPGFDNFASMMDHKGSFNAIAGVKAAWNLDAFYTDANARRKLHLERAAIEADRETFALNQSIQSAAQNRTIQGLQELQESDARLLQLRTNIRQSAEAQFANGIIDTQALLSKINDETTAALNAQYHHIQLIREIYRLKHIQ